MTGKNTKRILPGVVNKDKLSQLLKRDKILMQFLPAVFVFVALFGLVIASWQNAIRTREAQYNKAVEQRVLMTSNRLDERMRTSDTILRAGNGLLYGSDYVSGQEWNRFYRQLADDDKFVGVVMVGYAPKVQSSARMQFEESLRQAGTGTTIQTDGNPEVMVPVQYATKFNEKDTTLIPYGRDIYAIDAYRNAMNIARDSGVVSMTKVVENVALASKSVVLFMPIYKNGVPLETVSDRRAANTGYVFEVLNINQLFTNIADEKDLAFGLTVSQVNEGNKKATELFRSASLAQLNRTTRPVEQIVFTEYDKTWLLRFYANDDAIVLQNQSRPVDILVIGGILAAVAGVLSYLLLKYRTKIFALAEEQKLQQAKDELLSLASHQLRTPATGVKQYVGMVLDGFGGPVPKDQAKLLEQAYKSNERQLQIINEFLYVAKLGSGSLITTKHKFDLAPLVRDVISEMDMDVKERHHSIKTKIPKSVPVKADEHSVRMIIENLLSNAIKYTQPGGKIAVELKQSTREAMIVVKDNGVGISKRDQKQLFKQFSRIPNELTNEVSGSGIGLYLAQQLAVRNGGKITVESEPARGSTFTLTLPNWRVKKITMTRRGA